MDLEVELKYAVDDSSRVVAKLVELGAVERTDKTQIDHYFNAESRDFGETDEALRVRLDGTQACFTYKGPRLDKETKTRQEIEINLATEPDAIAKAEQLLKCLGFNSVARVQKQRKTYELVRQNHKVCCTIDDVDRLGTFVELEIVASQQDFEDAKQCILLTATELDLAEPIHKSYLELLLESDS